MEKYTQGQNLLIYIKLHKKQFYLFLVHILVGIVIQALYSDLQIEALVETIAIYGIMLTVDCNDGLINNETKLPNQSSYKVNVRLYGKYGYKYTIINIDFFSAAPFFGTV